MTRAMSNVSRIDFTVITLDLRGHGESGLPTEPADYTIDKMMQDVLAVADACEVERFTIWGFSFGGRVGRYLAAQSERVDKIILMGTPLGAGLSDEFRQEFEDFCAHWPPIIQAQRDGTLDLDSLSQDDREFLQTLQCSGDAGLGAGHDRLARHRTRRFSLPDAMARRFRRPSRDGQCQEIRAIPERLQGSKSYR